MKVAERIVIVSILLALIGGGAWLYFAVQYEHQEKLDAVARGEHEIRDEVVDLTEEEDWQKIYPGTVRALFGSTTIQVSVADSIGEKIKGLSDTPFLPKHVVKLFVFDVEGNHSIWMKDMNYPLDVIWLDKEGLVVHYKENISPETYPESFPSPTPAWYVVEANAGFVKENDIKIGDDFVILAE